MDTIHEIHWQQLDNAKQVAREACQRILSAAEQAIQTRGCFRIVLAGGQTPEHTYHLLRQVNLDWSPWHIYYGDERCLPETDPQRNNIMAARAWLDHVAIPIQQIYPIPAQLGAVAAAQHYTKMIQPILPFDMVLLGMGEDGHTASLFPGHTHDPNELVHPIFNAPKPPPERVSLSVAALCCTQELLFLVTGIHKQEAVMAWQRGDNLPVTQIRSQGKATVLIEQAVLGSS